MLTWICDCLNCLIFVYLHFLLHHRPVSNFWYALLTQLATHRLLSERQILYIVFVSYLHTCLVLIIAASDVAGTQLAACARYDHRHSCREMFWTAGQRVDLAHGPSPFVWKKTSGSCSDRMSEMRYTSWRSGEPNNAGAYAWNLQRVSPPLPEKCVQLCRGHQYAWNDAVCEIPTCSICEVDI